MKSKTFKILYINRGQWKIFKSSFSSVETAKQEIDNIRAEGKHPLSLNHKVVIYQFEGNEMIGNGIRY